MLVVVQNIEVKGIIPTAIISWEEEERMWCKQQSWFSQSDFHVIVAEVT